MKSEAIAIGQCFGALTVVAEGWVPNGSGKRARGLVCVCVCGSRRVVAPAKLRSGRTVSCGCRRNARMASVGASRRTHGHNARNSPTYRTWMSMVQRCENRNHEAYARYGGRGIEICERWRRSFKAFLSDMGERPEGRSLDRIDNDGDYEPGNCRWATAKEQTQNRSVTR